MNSFHQCDSCPLNCFSCKSKASYERCLGGYQWNENLIKCEKYNKGCLKCRNNQCEICESGICTKCFKNCDMCDDNSTCTKCKDGFYRDNVKIHVKNAKSIAHFDY